MRWQRCLLFVICECRIFKQTRIFQPNYKTVSEHGCDGTTFSLCWHTGITFIVSGLRIRSITQYF